MKPLAIPQFTRATRVAPRAGAWIETPRTVCYHKNEDVAPRAGAWIETYLSKYIVL